MRPVRNPHVSIRIELALCAPPGVGVASSEIGETPDVVALATLEKQRKIGNTLATNVSQRMR
jgi:hypothetical protein